MYVYASESPPSENPHVFRNGTNEKRESTRHRIKCTHTHAHANNLLTLQFLVCACVCCRCWWCFVIFFLLGFFFYKRTISTSTTTQRIKGARVEKKTSAGNWRVFKWKFTLNLKYLVNERVLFACLLLYITIFMYWIPSKWRLIKREDRASKQTNKQAKRKERKRQWKSESEIEIGGRDERIVKQNL